MKDGKKLVLLEDVIIEFVGKVYKLILKNVILDDRVEYIIFVKDKESIVLFFVEGDYYVFLYQ